jgi:hypothetical protein
MRGRGRDGKNFVMTPTTTVRSDNIYIYRKTSMMEKRSASRLQNFKSLF